MLGQTKSDDRAGVASSSTGFCNGQDVQGRDATGPAFQAAGTHVPRLEHREVPENFFKSICVHMLNSNWCEMRLHGSSVD